MPRLGGKTALRVDLVAPDEQTAAVYYLLGDGARSLEAYREPAVTQRVSVAGDDRVVNGLQASLVGLLLNGPRIALLESQSSGNPSAYSPVELGHDVAAAVWDNLETASVTERVLQRAYVSETRKLIAAWSKADAQEPAEARSAIALGIPAGIATLETDTGDDSVYPAWLSAYLPQLKSRLDVAAQRAEGEGDRLHFRQMSVEIGRLEAMLK